MRDKDFFSPNFEATYNDLDPADAPPPVPPGMAPNGYFIRVLGPGGRHIIDQALTVPARAMLEADKAREITLRWMEQHHPQGGTAVMYVYDGDTGTCEQTMEMDFVDN